jgi:hypothetical protein
MGCACVAGASGELAPAPAFARVAERCKLSCRVEHGSCGAVKLPKTFNEFLQPRRVRTKVRAFLNKLDNGDLVFEMHLVPRTLRRRLCSVFALHQALRAMGTAARSPIPMASRCVTIAASTPQWCGAEPRRLARSRFSDQYARA